MLRHYLLGTAGHVDHGKTALIRELTGVDTDRLPEEKQRGLTIDLGFASLRWEDLVLGIVDVPGHERFIKNMLAGVTGVDMALLVVAADEGVMPQTIEHFEALRHLQIQTGVIAITKCDLVDEEMNALVKEEVAQLVAGSFLQEAVVVHVSAKTGHGLEELRYQLVEAARQLSDQMLDGPFRLPVDRCFSLPGKGTIVTGSVASGQVSCGDKLQVMPDGRTVTVRSIESHGSGLPYVGRGQRAALNLTGVHYNEIERGDILATPDSIVPSDLLSVQFEVSRFRSKPLKSRNQIRFYSGTIEATGLLRPLTNEQVLPAQQEICQIDLHRPVCAMWGEAFVVRGLSDNEVLGGGRVIDPCAHRIAAGDIEKTERTLEMLTGDPPQRVTAVAALAGTRLWSVGRLAQRTGVSNGEALVNSLVDNGVLYACEVRGGTRWLHQEVVGKLKRRMLEVVSHEHEKAPARPRIPLSKIQPHFSTLESAALLTHLAKRLRDEGHLLLEDAQVALSTWRPVLSAQRKTQLTEMDRILLQAGVTPPSVSELAGQLDLALEEVELLLDVAMSRNEVVRLPDKDTRDASAARRARLHLHPDCERSFIEGLHAKLKDHPQWTVSQFCEAFGLSRKYAIPLCSYLDNNGITTRKGDVRRLNRPISSAK